MMKREQCGDGWPEEGKARKRYPKDMGAPKKLGWREVRRYRAASRNSCLLRSCRLPCLVDHAQVSNTRRMRPAQVVSVSLMKP